MDTKKAPRLPARSDRAELVLQRPPAGDRHPALVYLASLSRGSRRTMRQGLDRIAQLCAGEAVDAISFAWPALRYQHTAAIRSALAEQCAPATANKLLAALRGVLRESWRLGYMDAESYQRAVDLRGVPGSTVPAGRMLQPGEVRAMFESCATEGREAERQERAAPGAYLDAAILGLLLGCGLRRAEAVALDLAHYDGEAGELRVRGKGAKERLVPVENGQKDALDAWLRVRGEAPGALLCPVSRHGSIDLRPMTAQALYGRLRARAAKAGVKSFSPHDLRRSFVSGLLDAGADISAVQGLAGHANVATTTRYDRRGERAKRKAAGLLHLPYVAFSL